MSKKDINIRSYEGQDAFYSGSDAEYEEFLKNAEVSIDGEEAEPVENTQKINLGETINLQNVIDKFKKTAGGLGHSAKNIKESVANKMDMFKAKKEEDDASDTDGEFSLSDAKDAVTEKIQSSMQSSQKKLNEIKDEMEAIAEVPDKIGGVDTKLGGVSDSVDAISKQLEALSAKLGDMENRLTDDRKGSDKITVELMETMKGATDNIAEIKQAVGSVAKLNDSVFDLKNTQLNTKNAVSNLETAFARLKKKCVLGVTVLSILSAIVIVLEIVLMLS